MNLKPHDEGNYDVDRLDYILRDYLYNGIRLENYSHEQFKRRFAKVDENGKIIKNEDGSIEILSEEEENKDIQRKRIDVYENTSLKPIEQFLEMRVQAYKNMYFHSSVQVLDSLVGLFVINALNQKGDNTAKELKEFIKQLKEKDTEIDIQEYLGWDDIRFYKNCIEIAENSSNKNLRDFAGLIIPNLPSLMNLTFSHLDLKNARKNNYKNISEEEKAFVKKIKEIVYSNTHLSKILKDKEYYKKNIFVCDNEEEITKIREQLGDRVSFSTANVKGYTNDMPIYIKDKKGKVFALEEHPERSCDWLNRKEIINVAFAVIPLLKMQGYTDKQIEKIGSYFNGKQQEKSNIIQKGEKVNMSPLKTGSKMEEYFEIS